MQTSIVQLFSQKGSLMIWTYLPSYLVRHIHKLLIPNQTPKGDISLKRKRAICPKSWKHALPPLHNSTCPHPSFPPTDNIAADNIIGRIKQWTMDSKFQQVSFQNLWKAQWSEWLQLPCSMVWCNSRPCPVEPKQLYELYQTSQPSFHIESHSAFLTQSLDWKYITL